MKQDTVLLLDLMHALDPGDWVETTVTYEVRK